MLSKLLSNIANSEEVSLPDGLSGKVTKGDGNNSSQQVFQSLLQALQDDESADNRQLLALADSDEQSESGDGHAKTKIMGAAFIQTDTEESKASGQQAAQSILERLQQQLKNSNANDAELSNEASEERSSEEKAVDILPQKQPKTSEKADESKEAGSKTNQLKGEKVTGNDYEQPKQADEQSKEKLIDEVSNTDGKDQQKTEDTSTKIEQADTETVDQRSTESSKHAVNYEPKASNIADVPVEKNVEGRIKADDADSTEQEKKIRSEAGDQESKNSVQNNKQSQKVAATQSGTTQTYPKEDNEQKPDETQQRASGGLNADSENSQKVDGQAARLDDINSGNLGSSKQTEMPRQGKDAVDTKSYKEQDEQPWAGNTKGVKTDKTEFNDQQKKVIDSFFRQNMATPDKGFEIKNIKAEKDQKKTKEDADTEKDLSGSASKSGNRLLNRFGILNSENLRQDNSFSTQSISGVPTGDSQISIKEQDIIWEKHTAETGEADDEKEMNPSNASSSVRLGQMPVTNASLRQRILPGLTQSVQKAAAGAKKSPGDWQKHNFVLDDGKKIQLSVRESKGVLQVKMGSMNSDLSKLLQQNLQQIRDHLKQEFGSDIDLQLESHDQGEESTFSEGSETSDQKRNYRDRLSENEVSTERTGEVANNTVRSFGYNMMEWTA